MSIKKRLSLGLGATIVSATLVLAPAIPALAATAGMPGRTCGTQAFASGRATTIGSTTFTFYNPSKSPNTYVHTSAGGSTYAERDWPSNWSSFQTGSVSATAISGSPSSWCMAA
jgi:hypothetical protein